MAKKNKYLAKVKGQDLWITHKGSATDYTTDKDEATVFDQEYVKQVVKLCSTAEKPLTAVPK